MGYDAENETTAFSGSGGTAAYTYDGNGLRVVKSISAGTTKVSIFSGSSVLAEYDNGAAPNTLSREYIYNPADRETTGLLAMISGSATTYYHQDHFSVRLTTDGNGNVLAPDGHLPFGNGKKQKGALRTVLRSRVSVRKLSPLRSPLCAECAPAATFCSS